MLIFILLLIGEPEASKYIQKAKQKVVEVFPTSSISFVEIKINDYSKFSELCLPAKITVNEERILGFLAYGGDGKELGACFILNEIGKEAPITFLVCLSGEDEIRVKYIDILAYRETRGGEIRSRFFLNQFIGKNDEDRITVGGDIKNIRGATLSAWATTRVVRKAFAIHKALRLGIAEIIHRSEVSRGGTPYKLTNCYLIGDTYLCVECNCDKKTMAEMQKYAKKLHRDFSNFYWNGTTSSTISKLIDKYKTISKEVKYFDIFWHGNEKPDLGGVWKGFVVDRFAELLRKHNVTDYEIRFGWSSYYFHPAKYIDVFGNMLEAEGAVSISDLNSGYSKIFDPVSHKFVKGNVIILVFHRSAEFSDFASTLCAVWSECEEYVKNKGGKVLRFRY